MKNSTSNGVRIMYRNNGGKVSIIPRKGYDFKVTDKNKGIIDTLVLNNIPVSMIRVLCGTVFELTIDGGTIPHYYKLSNNINNGVK